MIFEHTLCNPPLTTDALIISWILLVAVIAVLLGIICEFVTFISSFELKHNQRTLINGAVTATNTTWSIKRTKNA